MNIYVSNLSFSTNDDGLKELFEKYGAVNSAKVILDRETGRSRGFGFVEMASDDEAQKAIDGLNNKDISGKTLSVKIARPREDRKGSYQVGSNFSKGGTGFKKRY